MIDASRFSSSFTAFWNMTTPMCENFVRKINLNQYDRFDAPIPHASTENRAFIAEFGFAWFIERVWPSRQFATESDRELVAKFEAEKRIRQLKDTASDVPEIISDAQRSEAKLIATRLESFIRYRMLAASPRPLFPGCGFIDVSEGDFIKNKTLFEVKTVERPFRGNDIRQLIMYCALNALAGKWDLENIGVYNPRRGIYFELDIDTVSREVSGKAPLYLFEDIYQAISGANISR